MLDEQVEDPFRHWPAQGQLAPGLGGGVEDDEQRVGAGWIGRERAEFILPLANGPTRLQLARDQANRLRTLSIGGGELEVHCPNLLKRQVGNHHLVTSRRRAAYPATSTIESRCAGSRVSLAS